MASTPMMADPARYRTIMYDLFFKGQAPVLTPEEQKRAKDHHPASGPSTPTRHELDALQALRAKASQLRGESAN